MQKEHDRQGGWVYITDCFAREKRVKRWRREWKFALIERGNPDWRDLYDQFV